MVENPTVEVTWEYRSLSSFGEDSLEGLASQYDLVMIDHPFVGKAALDGTLAPLDSLIDGSVLKSAAADALGPTFESYAYLGKQWALPVDAACQVGAIRADLHDGPAPATWAAVTEIARANPGRVALPLAPDQVICAFMTLCANAGSSVAKTSDRFVDRERGAQALDFLRELYALGPPEMIDWHQPDVLGRLTGTDTLVYVPIVFGFVTYSRADRVRSPCRFVDLPSAGHGPIGATLGGAGLAVSSSSKHLAEAAAFAAYAAATDAQVGVVARAGGQPSSRTAWTSDLADAESGGFFSGTRSTIERAWVRPRDPWWPEFQYVAGRLLYDALLSNARPSSVVAQLDATFRSAMRPRS